MQRDFTYIDDIVAGVIGSLDSAPPSSKATAKFRIYNLGNTNPTSVSDFVAILEKYAPAANDIAQVRGRGCGYEAQAGTQSCPLHGAGT